MGRRRTKSGFIVKFDSGRRSVQRIVLKGFNMPKTDNVGVITTDDNGLLYVVDSVVNGLLYCHPLTGPRTVRVVLPNHFWVLIGGL